jgi:hypothetical protein
MYNNFIPVLFLFISTCFQALKIIKLNSPNPYVNFSAFEKSFS